MKYIEHLMKLSHPQVMKLAKGKKIRVPHSALTGGEVKVYLTPQQSKKVETRLRKGLGMDVGPFDQSQIAHNIKFGQGFWDSFKRFLGRAAQVVNQEVLQPVMRGLAPAVSQARDRVVTRGINLGQDLIDRGLRRVGAGRKPVPTRGARAPGGGDKKGKLPPGLAKYMEEKRKMKAGEGFFSDVFRPVAGLAAEEGLKYAAPQIGKAISGKGLMGDFVFGDGMKPVRPKPKTKKMVGASYRLNARM